MAANPSPMPSIVVVLQSDHNSHFWDGAGGALIGALVGFLGALVVAFLVYRLTVKLTKAQLRQQIRSSQRALREQERANREIAQITADGNRRLTEEIAARDAAESIADMFHTLPRRLSELTQERAIERRQQEQVALLDDASRVIQGKRPAIKDQEVRERVEQSYFGLTNYLRWLNLCAESRMAWVRLQPPIAQPGPHLLPRTPEEDKATETILSFISYCHESLSSYRLGQELPPRKSTPDLLNGFDSVPTFVQ